jgi:hypothetical protein
MYAKHKLSRIVCGGQLLLKGDKCPSPLNVPPIEHGSKYCFRNQSRKIYYASIEHLKDFANETLVNA